MNSFINNLNSQTLKNVENNIVNPLSNRNMLRSSQAGNMYNTLAQANNSAIANYANELLGSTQSDLGSVLSNLMLMYMNGYNVLSDTQKQSLQTSQGNATSTSKATESGMSMSDMMNMAMQMAMLASSL